jgi:NAD(P)-dependent dehydrogenase (short-subunit alcohol dehydrogenase family)
MASFNVIGSFELASPVQMSKLEPMEELMAKALFKSANHAVAYCARSIAKKAVTEQLRDQGVRVTLVKPAEITERARVYLEEHPELYQQAFERAQRMGWVGQEPSQILVTPNRVFEKFLEIEHSPNADSVIGGQIAND